MTQSPFHGTSEMARRMRALDWSRTPLGPVDQWPQSLRTSVSTCLDCAFPIVLWSGPDLAILYNDEYAQILGPAKHPAALGERGAKVWAEIWDVIGPMLSQVMATAEPTRSRDLRLLIDRGYLEEAYFSFSYSPIHGDDGAVVGIFCPVIETTEKVIGERRLRTLRDLAARTKGAATEDETYAAAAATLAENPQDVPFALLYQVDDQGTVAHRKAAIGIEPGEATAPERVTLGAAGDRWLMQSVAGSGQSALLTDLRARFGALPGRRLDDRPRQRARAAGAAPRARSAAGDSRGGGEPDARARRRLPHVLRARRRRRWPPGSPTRRRWRTSGGGPRAWPSSTGPRRRSSPTSRTSSARR